MSMFATRPIAALAFTCGLVLPASAHAQAGLINGLDGRLDAAATTAEGGVVHRTVNCPARSINAVLAAVRPAAPLVLTINGVCTEAVVVQRDRLTLKGGAGGGITAPADTPAVLVSGARSTEIVGLTLTAAPGREGVRAERNADVRIVDASVQDSGAGTGAIGVFGTLGASVEVVNSRITGGPGLQYGVIFSDGAVGRMQGTVITMNVGEPAGDNGAVFLVRQATLLMRGGGNVAANLSTAPGALAMFAANGSSLRIDRRGVNPPDTVRGAQQFLHLANVDIRDAVIEGPMTISTMAAVRLADDTRNAPAKVTLTGGISVFTTALLQFREPAPTLAGNVRQCGGTIFSGPTTPVFLSGFGFVPC